MNVLVFDEQSDLLIDPHSVAPVVKSVLKLEKRKSDELAVYFVTVAKISELHLEFFDDPTPTDCISFPLDQENSDWLYHILGEIFISPKAAVEYAARSHLDPYQELTLYLVHGLLHLLGYDDLDTTDEAKMRIAEKRHMMHLLKKDLLLSKGG